MKKAMVIVLLAAGTVWAAEDEPTIQEKPLGEWMKQLRSDNRGFQLRAARALAEAPTNARPQIVAQVIPVLKSPRENDKFVAAQVLGDYGPVARAAVPDLLPMLKGTQYERNRAAAAKALGWIFKDATADKELDEVVDALTSKISDDYDKYSDVRREAVQALGMIGPAAKKAIPHLVRVMTHFCDGVGSSQDQEYRLVRRAAAWTCGRMGPLAVEHVDLLISRMHVEGTSCPEVVEALGFIGALRENIAPNIIDAIERAGRPGDAGWFKAKAFEALGKFGEKSAPTVPVMRRMLKDTTGDNSTDVKIAILKCLAALGPVGKEAVPEIQSHIGRGETKEQALKAYKAVTGQDFVAGEKK
jgi:HEAT repeat protein